MNKLLPFFLGIGIIILAFILRIIDIENLSIVDDEFIHVSAIHGIWEYGIPQMQTGMIYARGISFIYLTAFFDFFFNSPLFSTRITSIFWGCVLVGSGYALTYKYTKHTWSAFFTGVLLAVNPYLISFSDYGRFYMQFYALCFLSIWCFLWFREEHNTTSDTTKIIQKGIILSLLFILLLNSHDLGVFIIFILGIILGIQTLFKFITIKKIEKSDLIQFAPFVSSALYYILQYSVVKYLFENSVPGGVQRIVEKDPIIGQFYNHFDYYFSFLSFAHLPILMGAIFTFIVAIAFKYFSYEKYCTKINSSLLNAIIIIGAIGILLMCFLSFGFGNYKLRFFIPLIPIVIVLCGIGVFLVSQSFLPKIYKILFPIIFIIFWIITLKFPLSIYSGNSSDTQNTHQSISISSLLSISADERHSVLTHIPRHSTDEVVLKLKELLASKALAKKNTCIISTDSFSLFPYHINVDYSTNEYIAKSTIGYKQNGIFHDLFSGIPVLENAQMLQRIQAKYHGCWILADSRLRSHSNPNIYAYIIENTSVIYHSISQVALYQNGIPRYSEVLLYYLPLSHKERNKTSQ